jgi:AraC-like DNA-binding protein
MSLATAEPASGSHRRQPLMGAEFEHELLRDPALGFEIAPSNGIGCLAHGMPSRLDRWHYHDEYELHLVVETRGKAYIGDDIVDFWPGFLVLIGPRVPHHFVSIGAPASGVATRSLAIQFRDEPLLQSAALFPELRDALRLLERARHGIEFAGAGADLRERFEEIRSCTGLPRFAALAALLTRLARWPACRLLSAAPGPARILSEQSDIHAGRIGRAIDHICAHYMEELSLVRVSAFVGMGPQVFSRAFHRVTGSTFTEYVARTRITKACHLLRQSDHQVTSICYLVGFNNISNFNRQFRRFRGMTPIEYRSDKGFRRSSGA